MTTYNVNHEGVLIGGDKIIFQVDEEILHGATLRIEYVISITTAFDMNNIVINDLYSSDSVSYTHLDVYKRQHQKTLYTARVETCLV